MTRRVWAAVISIMLTTSAVSVHAAQIGVDSAWQPGYSSVATGSGSFVGKDGVATDAIKAWATTGTSGPGIIGTMPGVGRAFSATGDDVYRRFFTEQLVGGDVVRFQAYMPPVTSGIANAYSSIVLGRGSETSVAYGIVIDLRSNRSGNLTLNGVTLGPALNEPITVTMSYGADEIFTTSVVGKNSGITYTRVDDSPRSAPNQLLMVGNGAPAAFLVSSMSVNAPLPTPIPEPATLCGMALGTIGVLYVRTRRIRL